MGRGKIAWIITFFLACGTTGVAATDPLPNAFTKLENQAQWMFRRALDPSRQGSSPSGAELDQLSNQILALKPQILETLQSAATSTAQAGRFLDRYFALASSILNTRITLGQPIQPQWRDAFGISMSRSAFERIPRFQQGKLSVDPGKGGARDPVTIRLSLTYLQGLELGHLANRHDETQFVTLIRYLVYRKLQRNLLQIQNLRPSRIVSLPKLPPGFRDALSSLGSPKALLQEERLAWAEETRRKNFLEQLKRIQGELPPFFDAQTLAEIQRVIQMPNANPTIEKRLTTALDPVEVLARASETNASLSPRRIAFAWSEAALDQIKTWESELHIDAEKRLGLGALLQTQAERYARRLHPALFRELAQAVQGSLDSTSTLELRSRLIQELVSSSHELARAMGPNVGQEPVNMAALARYAANRLIQKMGKQEPRPEILAQLAFFESQPSSFESAKKLFTQALVQLTGPDVLFNGAIDPARVERHLVRANPVAELGIPSSIDPLRFPRQVLEMIHDRQELIRQLVRASELMGFTESRVSTIPTPRIGEILGNWTELHLYQEALKEEILTQRPLLDAKVLFTDIQERTRKVRLHQAVNELCPEKCGFPSPFAHERISGLLDQGLDQAERSYLSAFEEISSAKRIEEIRALPQAQALAMTLLRDYPQFDLSTKTFLDPHAPTTFRQILDSDTINPVLNYGWLFLAFVDGAGVLSKSKWIKTSKYLELFQFFKKTRPILESYYDVFRFGELKPLFDGFIQASTVFFTAELVDSVQGLRQFGKDAQISRLVFEGEVEGRPLISAEELRLARKSYRWSWAGVLGNALFTLPMQYEWVATTVLPWAEQKRLIFLLASCERLELHPVQLFDSDAEKSVQQALENKFKDPSLSSEARARLEADGRRLIAHARKLQLANPEESVQLINIILRAAK